MAESIIPNTINEQFVISTDTPKPYITIRKENNIAFVTINGMYRTGTTVSNGYRPTASTSIICTGYQNGVYFPTTLTIQTNGNVICMTHYNWGAAEATDNAISLNGSSAYIIG